MNLTSAYCINLEHRPERWDRTVNEFKTNASEFTLNRFDALRLRPGYIGCRESHLKLIEQHINDDYIFIVEDDARFLTKLYPVLSEAWQQLPADWEMLYLGVNFLSANHAKLLQKYSQNLVRITQSYGTYAYILNNTNGLVAEILSHRAEIRKIDVFFESVIQPRGHTFAVYPLTISCYDDFSDITNHQTDYDKRLIDAFYLNINENDT